MSYFSGYMSLGDAMKILTDYSNVLNDRPRMLVQLPNDDIVGGALDCVLAYINEVATNQDLNDDFRN